MICALERNVRCEVRIKGYHFGKQGLRRNILLVRPGNCTEQDAHLIEVMYFPKFTKYAMIKIGLQVKNSFSPILYLDVDTIVRQRF